MLLHIVVSIGNGVVFNFLMSQIFMNFLIKLASFSSCFLKFLKPFFELIQPQGPEDLLYVI